jgi:hypothetical protein
MPGSHLKGRTLRVITCVVACSSQTDRRSERKEYSAGKTKPPSTNSTTGLLYVRLPPAAIKNKRCSSGRGSLSAASQLCTASFHLLPLALFSGPSHTRPPGTRSSRRAREYIASPAQSNVCLPLHIGQGQIGFYKP